MSIWLFHKLLGSNRGGTLNDHPDSPMTLYARLVFSRSTKLVVGFETNPSLGGHGSGQQQTLRTRAGVRARQALPSFRALALGTADRCPAAAAPANQRGPAGVEHAGNREEERADTNPVEQVDILSEAGGRLVGRVGQPEDQRE